MSYQQKLLKSLIDLDVIKTGDFTLKSGMKSSIYIDLRVLLNEPSLIKEISFELYRKINFNNLNISNTKLCGIPYGALPFSCCLSTEFNIPQIIVRKEAKSYGTKKLIEGIFKDYDELILIEDIVTTGSSIIELIDKLKEYNLNVKQIIVIIDRSNNEMENVKKLGYNITSLFSIKDINKIFNNNI